MPGHIVHAECPCGYQDELGPGASDPGTVLVIAYDPAASRLVTVDQREAKRRRLRVVKDPFLRDPLPYQAGRLLECPKCRKETLAVSLRGFWD